MEKPLLMRIDASVICIILFILMLLTVVAGHKMRKKFWNVGRRGPEGRGECSVGCIIWLMGFLRLPLRLANPVPALKTRAGDDC